jgi:glycine hydroxymethyltransferase
MIVKVLEGLAQNGEAANANTEASVKAEAMALCARFPIYT